MRRDSQIAATRVSANGPRVHGFPPIWRADARVLVLGSMPGQASLAAGRYYAHPRNQFWPLLAALLDTAPTGDHALRLQQLMDGGIALWDVLASCERTGSLDSAIRNDSLIINDIPALLQQLPLIGRIACNGHAAFDLLKRHVALPVDRQIDVLRLPSTSPANAGLSFSAKCAAWQKALRAPA